jgi:hypothetical protein
MAVTTLSGVVDDNTLLSNRRIIDMDPDIKVLEPDAAPFCQLSMNARSRPAKSQKVEWLEDELIPRVTQNTGTLTNVATAVPVTAGTGLYFRVGDIARFSETGENVLVTAVAANTLTVTRGYGTITGTALTLAAGDIIRLGNAALEGATSPTFLVTKQVAAFNYCQIFRNNFGFTKTLQASELYGGPEPAFEAKKKLSEHKISIELQAFFGSRKLDTTGANPRAVMGGIADYISTNNTNIAGALTDKNTETFFRGAFRYGSQGDKTWFINPLTASALSSFPMGKLSPPSNDISKYGVSLQNYQSAQGQNCKIVTKRDWNDYQATTLQDGAVSYLIDMSNVVYRPLRTTSLLPDRQAPDEDSVKQEYLTEASFQFVHERSHAKIRNVLSY